MRRDDRKQKRTNDTAAAAAASSGQRQVRCAVVAVDAVAVAVAVAVGVGLVWCGRFRDWGCRGGWTEEWNRDGNAALQNMGIWEKCATGASLASLVPRSATAPQFLWRGQSPAGNDPRRRGMHDCGQHTAQRNERHSFAGHAPVLPHCRFKARISITG